MKKIASIIVLALLSATMLMAQTGVIVINDAEEHELKPGTLGLGVKSQTYDLTAPCSRLTLNAKHSPSGATTDKSQIGNMKIEQKVNGSWVLVYEGCPGIVTEGDITVPIFGTVIGKNEASVAYEQLSFDLNYRATQLRFTSAKGEKQIKDVCTYMASFVEVTPATVDFGEIEVFSSPVSLPFYVEHCNVARLNMSSSNADFVLSTSTVANSGIAQYKTDTFTVTFTLNIRGQHAATIVVSNGTQTDSIHCSARVTKKNPVLTWLAPAEIMVGEEVETPVESTCSNEFALMSCSENVQIVCGAIKALSEGEATITVMQLGDDDYWNNKIQDFTITVNPAPETPTAVEARRAEGEAERYVQNGQVYIRAKEATYHVDGQRQK